MLKKEDLVEILSQDCEGLLWSLNLEIDPKSMIVKAIQCEKSAYYKLFLAFILQTDPFSLIKLLDCITSPQFKPLLTLELSALLLITYDLLPPLHPSAYIADPLSHLDYSDSLVLI